MCTSFYIFHSFIDFVKKYILVNFYHRNILPWKPIQKKKNILACASKEIDCVCDVRIVNCNFKLNPNLEDIKLTITWNCYMVDKRRIQNQHGLA